MAAFLISYLAELYLDLEQGQTPCSPSEKHLQVLLVLVADNEGVRNGCALCDLSKGALLSEEGSCAERTSQINL